MVGESIILESRSTITYPDLIGLGNAFRDANNQANFRLDSFNDSISGGWRGYVENSRVWADFPNCLTFVIDRFSVANQTA